MRIVWPFSSLSVTRACARVDSGIDKAKICSDRRVDADGPRLRAVFGGRKSVFTQPGSNSEVRRCNREVCFARVSRHRQISRSGLVREESTLKPARSRKSLALRMHQVNTGDLQ